MDDVGFLLTLFSLSNHNNFAHILARKEKKSGNPGQMGNYGKLSLGNGSSLSLFSLLSLSLTSEAFWVGTVEREKKASCLPSNYLSDPN